MGELQLYPVKTAAGRRDLPLLPIAKTVFDLRRQAQAADRAQLGRAWLDNGLVFTTKTGRPIEPRNLVRSFHRICDGNKFRPIKVHHLRHTTATLLKNLGVPARDAQIILGHSRLAVTLEIYTHEDRQAQREALGRISKALGHASELPSADEKDGEQVSNVGANRQLIFGLAAFWLARPAVARPAGFNPQPAA
jgi:integrase